MSDKNFYISYYNSLVNREVNKFAKLSLYSDKEKSNFPNEYNELNYNNIFKYADADDYIENLVKSKKYNDFYILVILEKKALAANYYLSCYKAMIEKNSQQLIYLVDLSFADKINILNTFPELSYDEIFEVSDPEDYLASMANVDFVESFNENYYLSFYQAVLDKNLTKAVMLYKISTEDKIIYPKENYTFNASEIFEDKNYLQYINKLLRKEEYYDFSLSYDDAINPLVTEKTIARKNYNVHEISNYPIIDYCSNDKSLIIDNILSVTYSKYFNKEYLAKELVKITDSMNNSTIIKDILLVTLSSIKVPSNNPFNIILIGDDIQEYNPTMQTGVGGYYNNLNNKLVVTNKGSTINLKFIIHELAHKIMSDLFKNAADPYSDYSKKLYHDAIKNTLLNIQEYVYKKFALEIIFENTNDTWKMGKILSSMLFPQTLEANEIQKVINLFDQHGLNIDKQYSWLEGESLLSKLMSHGKFEQADILVEAGFNIPFIPSYMDYSSLLNWFIWHNKEIDIDYQDSTGKTILDYVGYNSELYKIIIENAAIYPPNLMPQCFVEFDILKVKYNDNLEVLKDLLCFYNEGVYNKNDEDAEFIVRMPQAIIAGLYQGEIVEIFSPMAEYWNEVITPEAQKYLNKHSDIDFYGAIGLYED